MKLALHGSEYSSSSGNIEIQERNWVVLHPDRYASVSYDITLDIIGKHRLKVKTLAGSEETLLFGGSVCFDNKFVGDIEVHRSFGTNNMHVSEFVLDATTRGKHTITISNKVGRKIVKTHRLHLRIIEISVDLDTGIESVIAGREMFVLHESCGTFAMQHGMGLLRRMLKEKAYGSVDDRYTKKILSLGGSEYSSGSGSVETQEKNWVILHPDQYASVSYDVTLDAIGKYQLNVKTLAGLEEKLVFGGSVYFDNNFIGNIGVHWSNSTNNLQGNEFVLDAATRGKHRVTISNEAREKKSGKVLCWLHLRVMEISIYLDIGIKAVIDNPEMFGLTEEFVETLDKYLSGLKEIGNGRLYEKNFMAHISVDHFKIYTDYINKFKTISGSNVLELGCGSGGSLPQLESYGAKVVGIEIEPDLIKLTNSRLKASKTAYCVQADGFCLPFPDGTFDICICSHVLEHVAYPHKLVREINRILKIGGVALIEFPNRLYPIEPHGNLFLISYLPLKVARLYATFSCSMRFVSDEYKSRLNVMHLLQGEYSYFSIKKIIKNLPFTICDVNPIDRLVLDMPPFKKYPYKLKRLLSLLISRNITIIVKKEKAAQSENLISLKPYSENLKENY